MSIKKTICAFLAACTFMYPVTSGAVDLGNAFNTLLGPNASAVANGPGRYQSGARIGFTGGGLDIRVPRGGNVPALFSITPPNFEAGCNGISAHFGGFSFISGAEFEALLKQIASGAVTGFVTSLLFKTLCPICEAVIQELKTAAQVAARLARDSCAIGKELGNKFLAGMGVTPDSSSLCAVTASAKNGSPDALSAFSGLCDGLQSVHSTLKDFNEATASFAGGGAGDAKANEIAKELSTSCGASTGNLTWNRLNALDAAGGITTDDDSYRRKLILMNIMGIEMVHGGEAGSCELPGSSEPLKTTEKDARPPYCPPPLSAEQLVGVFMCGDLETVAALPATSSVRKYCSDVYDYQAAGVSGGASANANNRVWTCEGADGDSLKRATCLNVKLVPVKDVVKGTGILLQVNTLLRDAVARVRSNTPFHTNVNGIDGTRIIQLLQAAPYPLYQAINAAAVYPAAAEELMDTMSVLVAEQFAYALFDETIRLSGRSAPGGGYCITKNQADSMLEFIGKLRAFNHSRKVQIAQNFTVQEGLTEQIRQLNVAIQRQVISADMLHNGQAAQAFNKAVSASIKGGSPVTNP